MRTSSAYLLATVLVALSPFAQAEDIVVGVPIAQTGPVAFVGTPALNAMKIAVDDANATHALGPDRTLKLITADDASDRTQATTIANQMIHGQNAIALLGAVGTPLSLTIAAVANEQQIPFIGLATSSAITETGKWSFHVAGGPNVQVASVMDYVYQHYKPKTMATIWARDNESTIAQGKFARDWMNGKTTLLPEESILTNDTDYSAVATKLAYEKPDVVFIASGVEASGANIVLQLRQAGLKSVLVSNTNAVGPGFLRMTGKAGEEIVAMADYLPSREDPINQSFVAEYSKRYGGTPDNWAALGYTMMQITAHAIVASGSNPTRASVRDMMEKTKDLATVTGAGLYSYDKNREPSYGMAILVVKDGQWVQAPK